MLIRFTVLAIDRDSGRNQGILVAAHTLRDEGPLTATEHVELNACLSWFNEHLPLPSLLGEAEHRRAISWFKSGALEAIQRMWSLKRLLDSHGCHVEVIRTADPGVIVYEDDWQVVAKPHKNQRFQR
ncbi:hypothetical protein M2650_14955 [Luteimonas sp. SX5]|uniref:Uncharacterized protein n=1 Tax=Luteimonas galliterrae TaxID=2940486 RepID=A0ABT0MM15_9GAMM|nr:hypothetical protein [Luteimonas galliterrae]MCL1635922.1 hypothetical protein [Luteimonas galliterrae]